MRKFVMALKNVYRPCENLLEHATNGNFGVLVLNSPIQMANEALWKIWNHAKIRVLVDGGSNFWCSWMNQNENKLKLSVPHLVSGDFDSIEPENLTFFRGNSKIRVVHTPDVDETDFTKALREFRKYQTDQRVKIESIYVFTQVAGRMDHLMANVSTLIKSREILDQVNVFLLDAESISWILFKGSHSISIPPKLRENGEWCGLIPIGRPATLTTHGLKWNLNETKMEFGELVSTSNTYNNSPFVEVETDCSILWTMSIKNIL